MKGSYLMAQRVLLHNRRPQEKVRIDSKATVQSLANTTYNDIYKYVYVCASSNLHIHVDISIGTHYI